MNRRIVVSRASILLFVCFAFIFAWVPQVKADTIQSVDPSPSPVSSSSPTPTSSPVAIVPEILIAPTPEPTEPVRIELDFTSISFDNLWQSGNGNTASAHNILTSPEDFALRILFDKWLIQGRYFSNEVDTTGGTINDQAYSDIAVAYEVRSQLYLGLWGSLNRSNLSNNVIQDYTFGPFARISMPLSKITNLEIQGGVGPDIRSIDESSVQSQISFAANESVYVAVRVANRVRLLFGGDAWQKLGSLSGGANSLGAIGDTTYRLRVVPIGLRVQL